MNKKLDNNFQFDEEINFRDILLRYVLHWKWFVTSLSICFLWVIFQLRYTHTNYESNASLLIQLEQGGAYSELSAFQDLGLFEGIGDYNNMYNEQQILISRPLVESAVRKLHLDIQHFLIGSRTGIERKEYYKNSPIIIDILNHDTIDIKASSILTVEGMTSGTFKFIDSEEFGTTTYNYGDTLHIDNLGDFVISTTNFYLEGNLPIRITLNIHTITNTVSKYQSALNVQPVNDLVDILKLSLRGPIIEKNNDFLNALIEEHTTQTIDDQQKIYKNTTSFINDRIVELSNELSDVESDGEDYKTKYDFSDVFLNERSLYDRQIVNEKKLVDAQIQLQLATFLYEYLADHKSNDELLPANLGFEDPSINNSTSEFNKLALERQYLIGMSSIKNPVITKLDSDLDNIKSSLLISLENLNSTLELEVGALERMENQIGSKISSLPKHKRILRSIDRQQQVKESLYLYLLQKREENEIASAVTEGNSKIIEAAFSNGAPVSPRKKLYYAGALFIGLFVPFIFIYLRGLLDNKVHGKSDLDKFNLPHLATIPKIESNQKIVISKGNTSPEAEAFRILRTNSSFILGPNTGKGPSTMLADLIEHEVTEDEKFDINYNVQQYKQLCK